MRSGPLNPVKAHVDAAAVSCECKTSNCQEESILNRRGLGLIKASLINGNGGNEPVKSSSKTTPMAEEGDRAYRDRYGYLIGVRFERKQRKEERRKTGMVWR